jgi:hypothetical protein
VPHLYPITQRCNVNTANGQSVNLSNARPFKRYSVNLTVCGSIFNLEIFYRAGRVVSKDYSIIKDLETFIRIIRRLGRELDAYDLGLDRTVVSLGSCPTFPEARVMVGGLAYVTQGLPLWQLTSLVGCGTLVWIVVVEVDAECRNSSPFMPICYPDRVYYYSRRRTSGATSRGNQDTVCYTTDSELLFLSSDCYLRFPITQIPFIRFVYPCFLCI